MFGGSDTGSVWVRQIKVKWMYASASARMSQTLEFRKDLTGSRACWVAEYAGAVCFISSTFVLPKKASGLTLGDTEAFSV